MAAPAQATFPGRNGSILMVERLQRSGVYGEGQLVAIDPRTGRERTLWRCGGPAQPIPECDAVTTSAVSPRGDTAAVMSTRSVELSLSVVQYTAGPTVLDLHRRLMFDGTLGPAIGPLGAASFDWTIDGRAAFGAGSTLFVLSPDGSRRQLTRRGGTDPSWSPRGRWIAFTRPARSGLSGAEVVVPSSSRRRAVRARRGPRTGRQIAFLRRARGPATTGGLYLWVLDRRGGPARRLGDEPVEPVGYGPSGFLASPPEWQPLPR